MSSPPCLKFFWNLTFVQLKLSQQLSTPFIYNEIFKTSLRPSNYLYSFPLEINCLCSTSSTAVKQAFVWVETPYTIICDTWKSWLLTRLDNDGVRYLWHPAQVPVAWHLPLTGGGRHPPHFAVCGNMWVRWHLEPQPEPEPHADHAGHSEGHDSPKAHVHDEMLCRVGCTTLEIKSKQFSQGGTNLYIYGIVSTNSSSRTGYRNIKHQCVRKRSSSSFWGGGRGEGLTLCY